MADGGLRRALMDRKTNTPASSAPGNQAWRIAAAIEPTRAVSASMLTPGRQALIPGKPLAYGQSITDGCVGWEVSTRILEDLASAVRARRRAAKPARVVAGLCEDSR